MGYHLTILRARPIHVEELVQAIEGMSGRLRFDREAQPDPVVYATAKEEHGEIMRFDDGELWAKNPSEHFLRLMIELAGLLGARVRGDELETYRSVDETYHHPDDREQIEQAALLSREMVRRQRRRDWISRIAPMVVAALIAWIYARYIK